MNNVLVAGTGAIILLFAITYEYMKVKKGHTSNHEGPIIAAYIGTLVLLFVATKEYLRLKGYTKVHSWH
jgi:hypothetical protein